MLPEVKPSRSNATKRKPADRTAATTSPRRARTAGEGLRLELEAGGRPVVAHPELPEPERTQCRLGRLDGLQAAEGDRGAVGQSGGQAGRRRLVPGAQAELLGHVADVVLGEPGLHQRKGRPGRGRGLLAGPMVAQVAHVHPEHHPGRLRLGQRAQHRHQGRLAAGAPVGAVGHVGRILHFVGGNADPAQIPLLRQGAAVVRLGGGQGGREGRGAQHPGPAERVLCHLGQQGGVRPAAERHHHPPQLAELVAQGGEGGRHAEPPAAPRPRAASTASRSPTMPA